MCGCYMIDVVMLWIYLCLGKMDFYVLVGCSSLWNFSWEIEINLNLDLSEIDGCKGWEVELVCS